MMLGENRLTFRRKQHRHELPGEIHLFGGPQHAHRHGRYHVLVGGDGHRFRPIRKVGRRGAAAALKINPHTLRARMRKLGIDWNAFRQDED